MAGPQLAPFYLQRCPLHSCQVDRIEKCPSTKSAACGLRNPYPMSVWCNSVTPCIYQLKYYPALTCFGSFIFHLTVRLLRHTLTRATPGSTASKSIFPKLQESD